MPKTQYGTVLKKSGSWAGRYSRWVTDVTTGEKKRLQKSFVIGSVDKMTKAEARRLLRIRIEQELNLRADSRINVKFFIEHRWQPLRESTWRDSTKETNEWILSHITKEFGAVPLEDCDAVTLQLWLNRLAKTHSGSLVRHVRIFLKSIFNEAVEQDFLRKSPARLLRIPVLKSVTKPFLTVEQVHSLLNVATGRDRIILRLFLVTGLRPSELFALRYRALDVEHGLLNITESVYRGVVRPWSKTTDENSPKYLTQVFLPQEVVTDLVAFKKLEDGYPNDFIFSSSSLNKPLLKENWQQRNLNPLVCRAFHDGKCEDGACEGEGVPLVNYQVLRRTVATHVQGSAKDTQTLLRHTKPQTAQAEYVQPMEESVRSAVDKLAGTLLSVDQESEHPLSGDAPKP